MMLKFLYFIVQFNNFYIVDKHLQVMKLFCFDQYCNISIDGERTKFFYNPDEKLLIGYYFNDSGALFKGSMFEKLALSSIQKMKDFISGDKIDDELMRYLGEIDVQDAEIKKALYLWDYHERLAGKKEKTKEMFDRENKVLELFNQKVKSLADLIK